MGVVAVIPYRDRAPQIAKLIPELLKRGVDRVVVAEQTAGTPFNRGLAKNVGAVHGRIGDKDTMYFHDTDLLPGREMWTYAAVPDDTIVHHYGHRHCLGGVVGMTPATFRKVGGFCVDQWAWGGEDRWLQQAAEAAGVTIDRSQFRQRFTSDDWFVELDTTGRPIPGPEARRQFLQDPKVGTVPERAVAPPGLPRTAASVASVHTSISRVDGRIETVLYTPKIRDLSDGNPAAAGS